MGCVICDITEKNNHNGIFGFSNVNGHCFINSVLQIFTHLDIFNLEINNFMNNNNKENFL